MWRDVSGVCVDGRDGVAGGDAWAVAPPVPGPPSVFQGEWSGDETIKLAKSQARAFAEYF
jgi:hypothetical protein